MTKADQPHSTTTPADVIYLTRLQMAANMGRAIKVMIDASAALGDAAEALLAQLDLLTGNADEEPSLASPEGLAGASVHAGRNLNQAHWAAGAADDAEEDDEREPDEDGEHTLGWAENVDQRRLGLGSDDREPSLGSIGDYGNVSQSHWAQGDMSGQDREEACEDEGIDTDTEGDDEEGGAGYDYADDGHDQTRITGPATEADVSGGAR